MAIKKHRCISCPNETAHVYHKKDGTGPYCYECMRQSGEFPAIITLGDGVTQICATDKYIMERHRTRQDGTKYYLDDFGRETPCGMFPDYSAKDAPPKSHR